jgi:hypothetical protein
MNTEMGNAGCSFRVRLPLFKNQSLLSGGEEHKMAELTSPKDQITQDTASIKAFVRNLGVDLVGIADMKRLEGIPCGLPGESRLLLEKYPYAIVLGLQFKEVGDGRSGDRPALFLEQVAMTLMFQLTEALQHRALIVHTEDEFDPEQRIGLLSLKALAKGAGLGWQGRSLLVVSPEYGPLHRLVAVLTDMPWRRIRQCRINVNFAPYVLISAHKRL